MEARSRRLGLQRGNSVGRAVFLSKRQACRGVLPTRNAAYRRVGYTPRTPSRHRVF